MDLVYKIVVIGIITSIATLIIKPIRNDFAIFIALAGGVVILALLLGLLGDVSSVIKSIIGTTGLSGNLYSLILKIVGIGYLIEFTAGLCNDTGNSSLGDKVLLGGKIIIMVMALPIITSILKVIMEILPT